MKKNFRPAQGKNASPKGPGKPAESPFAKYRKTPKPPRPGKNTPHPAPRKKGGATTGQKTAGSGHDHARDPRSEKELSAVTEIFPLNKYLAHAGLCARRKAVEYIQAGDVSVNGIVITKPGFKVNEKDTVRYKGKRLLLQKEPVYILMNKPKGYITTTDDPQERRTVMELISRATTERVYPVGRLDRNTSGLLLLTNDGDLSQQLAHPGNNIKKLYHVALDKPLTKHHFEKIAAGLELEDGPALVDALAYEDADDRKQIGIEIHSGRNRIVRRIFEFLGYEVKSLDRVLYAGLTKKNLPRGKWRMLTPREVVLLKHLKSGRGETADPKSPK
jgi:23S rRNA pseudouridine2605 synthase